jgi:hypothetical protein
MRREAGHPIITAYVGMARQSQYGFNEMLGARFRGR